MQRVERSAMLSSGAVPVYNVDTGETEEEEEEVKQKQKRARLLVRAIHAQPQIAYNLTCTLLDSCADNGVEAPRTPEVASSLHTIFSIPKDTLEEVALRNRKEMAARNREYNCRRMCGPDDEDENEDNSH